MDIEAGQKYLKNEAAFGQLQTYKYSYMSSSGIFRIEPSGVISNPDALILPIPSQLFR